MGCASSKEETATPSAEKPVVYKKEEPKAEETKPTQPEDVLVQPAAEAEDEDEEEVPPQTLPPGPKRDEVMALFSLFDVTSEGKISIASLKGATMKVGPNETSLLQTLADMDFNGDGYVEESEWELYFATIDAALSEEELKMVMEDLETAGSNNVTMHESAPPQTLSGTKKEEVMAVFRLFDVTKAGTISLASLKGVTMQVGPNETKLLQTLADMDFNGDGYVEESEWELYFATVDAALSEEELKMVMEELETAGRHIATVHECTQIAGGDDAEDEPADPEAAEEAAAELASLTLTDEQTKMVEALFKAWDFGGNGQISREKMQMTGVDVGPHKEKVFGCFEQMDVNNDNVVTLDEMLQYFRVAASLMSDDELREMVDEMNELADAERSVLSLVKLAGDAKAEGEDEAPVDEEEVELPPLSEARRELVTGLFKAYSSDIYTPIDLESLKTAGLVELGPVKESVVEGLVAMDKNGDGMVEYDEMIFYFQFVCSELSDTDFETILGDLKDKAASITVLKVAESQA